MKSMRTLLAVGLVLAVVLVPITESTTWFSRLADLLDYFENGVPFDQMIDDGAPRTGISAQSDDAVDPDGYLINVTGSGITIFDDQVNYLLCSDMGMCFCDSAVITKTFPGDIPDPNPTGTNGLNTVGTPCIIAPFVAAKTGGSVNKYHMAASIIDSTSVQYEHIVDRVGAEVNTAYHWYRTTWTMDKGVKVTWKINTDGLENVFQMVIAVGQNTVTNTLETYVLFLYEKMEIAGNGLQGQVSDSAGNYARICPEYTPGSNPTDAAPRSELLTHTNHRCGNKGIFVFGTKLTSDSCSDATACMGTPNPNCNHTMVPETTCTETFYCEINDDNPSIRHIDLYLSFQWYLWPTIVPLSYTNFIGSGTPQNPVGKQEIYIETALTQTSPKICSANMTDPGMPWSNYTHKISIPVSLTLATGNIECGMFWDQAAGTVSFAYKNFDGLENHKNIDRYGDLIFYGTCKPLEKKVTVQMDLNDYSPPQNVIRTGRNAWMIVVDRPSGVGSQEIRRARIGRRYHILVGFNPGTPFTAWADPTGLEVLKCDSANNPGFISNSGPTTWERSETFIDNGCPVDKASLYGPVFLDRSFSADPLVVPTGSDEPNGTTWFLISGQIRAAKWAYNSSTSSIYLRCYTKPCVEKPDLPKCIDNCATDNSRKRRSVSDYEDFDALYTMLEIEDDEEPEPATDTKKPLRENCTNFSTAMTTMTVLLAMLLLMSTFCVLLAVKVTSLKNHIKRRQMSKASM